MKSEKNPTPTTTPVTVHQKDEANPVPAEVIADAIVEISKAMKALSNTRLTRRALVTLIAYESKVPRRDIEIVLNNLDRLEDTWLKRK